MTQFELRRLAYGNGFLHGLVNDGDRELFALHVHGTGGSFYRLTISTAFANVYLDAGADYATVNVPAPATTPRTRSSRQACPRCAPGWRNCPADVI